MSLTREDLVRAIVTEIRRRGSKAAECAVEIADAVADAVGLTVALEDRETLRGAGIWLRLGSRPDPEDVVAHLDYVIVPLHSGERGPLHAGPTLRDWLGEVRAGGVSIWAMDWLPRVGQTSHLADLADRARKLGCAGIVADIEPDAGWRERDREASAYRSELARVRGNLDLAVTDYARGGIGRTALASLLARIDGHRPVGIPQSYDPDGRYDETYHARNVAYWQGRGAQRIVLGVGAWLRGERRHRTPDEFRWHLSSIPEGVQGVCAWYADAKALRPLLPVLAEAVA